MKNIIVVILVFINASLLFGQLEFEELQPESTRVNYVNTLTESENLNVLTYQYYHNGGGVCIGDINNDGRPDIYFSSNMEPNRLYMNQGGFQFKDISEKAGTHGDRGWATGACMVDVNNDGWLDIYVIKSGNGSPESRKNRLYVNNRDLTFTETSAEYGLDDDGYGTQAYFFDYDKDGDLDMFMLNHQIEPYNPTTEKEADFNFERDALAGDRLYRNDQGKYIDISEEAGILGSPIGYGLSASIGDLNEDGFPDIYVCNDYLERDYLYMNNGDGTFTDELISRTKHISNYSMGSDVADIDNDGHMDIMVADMAAEGNYRSKTNMSGMNPERFWNYVDHGFHYQYMINTLQRNNGNGTFAEIAQLAGVDKTDWSWAPLLADFNQDGLKDMFVTNGLRKDARNNDFVKKKIALMADVNSQESAIAAMREVLELMPVEPIKNYLFTNEGSLHFTNEKNKGIDSPTFSNGAAYGDLDGDGDLDLVVNNIDQVASIYRNNSVSGNAILVKLIGPSTNRSGIGARVHVTTINGVQTSDHYLARGYLSSVDDKLHFGVGSAEQIDLIEVIWTDGTVSRLQNVKVNQIVVVKYSDAVNEKIQTSRETIALTSELRVLDFTHEENKFDDFEREVLLPHKMSNLGPALAVADVNGDGREDFYVGGAVGQSGALFLQNSDGSFMKSQQVLWDLNKGSEEVIATFFDYDGDGDLDLYVGNGGNEYTNGSKQLLDKLYQNNKGRFTAVSILPNSVATSTGCAIPLDFDKDGDLDLFIGSRQTPGKYPYASSSLLLENTGGKFTDVTATKAPVFEDLGMVTDGVWTDLNGDGMNELIVCGEWMSLTALLWDGTTWVDKSGNFDLDKSNGWWNCLTVGDLNKDGNLDLLGGNLGLNYKYHATENGPFQVYSDDINGDGKNDIVLGYNQEGKTFPLRGRSCSSEQIPELQEAFPTYDLFAKATLEEVYGEKLDTALHLSVYDFASCIYFNEEGDFTRYNFPHAMQRSSWNEILLCDLNKDGLMDIISAGNLYEAEVETPRCDAGNGLVLLAMKNGTYREASIPDVNWGEGNTKRLALINVNGKTGVLVGKNNATLTLLILGE